MNDISSLLKEFVLKFAIIIVIVIAVIVVVKILNPFEDKVLNYTQMDQPEETTTVMKAFNAIRSLNNAHTAEIAEKACPDKKLLKKVINAYREKYKELWVSQGSHERGGTYETFMYYSSYTADSLDNDHSQMIIQTDKSLRDLIEKGYTYRISWPNIHYIGYTTTMSDIKEVTLMVLYFEDQDRIFSVNIKGMKSSNLTGAYIKDLSFSRVDNPTNSLKNFFKTLFKN